MAIEPVSRVRGEGRRPRRTNASSTGAWSAAFPYLARIVSPEGVPAGAAAEAAAGFMVGRTDVRSRASSLSESVGGPLAGWTNLGGSDRRRLGSGAARGGLNGVLAIFWHADGPSARQFG